MYFNIVCLFELWFYSVPSTVIDVFSFRCYYFLVPSYHFVSPESVQNTQHRNTTDLSKEYLLNAFGVEHHLYLLPYIDLVSSGKYCILLSWYKFPPYSVQNFNVVATYDFFSLKYQSDFFTMFKNLQIKFCFF